MVVTWVTLDSTNTSTVEYGLDVGSMTLTSNLGIAEKFVDSGKLKRSMYMHRVTLLDLKPDTRYG